MLTATQFQSSSYKHTHWAESSFPWWEEEEGYKEQPDRLSFSNSGSSAARVPSRSDPEGGIYLTIQ